MRKTILAALFLLMVWVVTLPQHQGTQGGYPAYRLRRLTADPATCTPGDVYFNTATAHNRTCTVTNTWSDFPGTGATQATILTTGNCSSSAAPAVCSSSAAGSVVVAAAATTVTVNTTAVTANSQVFVQFDSSLGTKLGVTCNTTFTQPTISARTGATSFQITVASAPTTNPACFSYLIVN